MRSHIYLIGAGAISHHHAQACGSISGAKLFAADPNPEARDRFKKDFPDARLYTNADDMLAEPRGEHDVVVVATPPRLHVPEALKALQSGRSVLVEKPLAMNVAEAERLLETATASGLHIGSCVNRFQSWPPNRAVRKRIREGALGKVYLVDWIHRNSCQRTGIEYQNGSWWFLDSRQNGGGTLMDWGPYDFDVMLTLFEPVAVTVDHALCEHPDLPEPIPEGVVFDTETQVVAALTLHSPDGAPIRVRYERTSGTHGAPEERVGVYGEKGHLSWNWLPYRETSTLTIRRTTGPDGAATHESVDVSTDEAPNWMFEPLLRFRDFVLGGSGAAGRFDARALDDLRIIRAIYASAASGCPTRVELAGPENGSTPKEKA